MNLKKLIPVREGSPNCSQCGGVGFSLTVNVSGAFSGVLSLCHCISENCPCEGKSPWRIYDEKERKLVPCICQSARIELGKYEMIFKKSGIPQKYKFRTLDQMDQDETIGVDFTIAHDWASDMVLNWKPDKTSSQGLYLWGPPGSGKTLLACGILNELIFRYKVNCKYAKINRDFLDALKDTYQRDSQFHGKEKSIETEFAEVEVLVLDDFGVQKETDWSNSKLYDLIDARYEKEKLTILTSNHPSIALKEQAEGRVYSRLQEMVHEIHLEDCGDYREKLIK
ncbi:AFG1/ZapE family ATPase (plasmid) [Leptospira sp. WS92.C1]